MAGNLTRFVLNMKSFGFDLYLFTLKKLFIDKKSTIEFF